MKTPFELDAMIAEKLFDWKWYAGALPKRTGEDVFYRGIFPHKPKHLYKMRLATGKEPLFSDWDRDLPHYSTTWQGTGLIVAAMRERGFSVSIYGPRGPGDYLLYSAAFAPTANNERWVDWGDASAATIPEAVAWAALMHLTGLVEVSRLQELGH